MYNVLLNLQQPFSHLLCYSQFIHVPRHDGQVSQNAPESISERLKFQKFSGGGMPPDPPSYCALRAQYIYLYCAWPDHSNLACSGPVLHMFFCTAIIFLSTL